MRAIASLHGRTDRVEEVLERARADRRSPTAACEACSGGEQQRLKFALALLPDPDLVILDEPTTGMDVTARRDFWQTMRADAAAGRTVVFATHYLAEADEFAERIVLMNARPDRARRRRPPTCAPPTADAPSPSGRPPTSVDSGGIDAAWLARVQQALEPLGVTDLEVVGRQPRGGLHRPDQRHRGDADAGRSSP